MKALHSRGHRPLRLAISKYEPGPVAGPGLSAVRAACKPHEANLAGLELVFDAIGGHLDESLAHRAIDEGFRANGRGVRVAISDVRWRGRVLTTEFGVEEIAPLMRKADGFFDHCEINRGGSFQGTELSDAVCACWVQWSRHAHKSFRRCVPAWNDLADVSVGALLLSTPAIRRDLARIAGSGNVPALIIALDSSRATAVHLKCSVRGVAVSLPAWMRASGAVAGHG